jgi:hypothetical protein
VWSWTHSSVANSSSLHADSLHADSLDADSIHADSLHADSIQSNSVHRAPWPTPEELGVDARPGGLLPLASQALIGIRRAKTDAKASQKTPITRAVIAAPTLLELAAGDLAAVGRIASLTISPADEISVLEIELAELPPT